MVEPEFFLRESFSFSLRVQHIASDAFVIITENGLLTHADRKAFVLTVQLYGSGTPMVKTIIGKSFPDAEFRRGCWELSEEKVRRQITNGDVSSYCSRDIEKRQYGGSIKASTYIGVGRFQDWGISVSGLTELEDEALAIIIAMKTFHLPIKNRIIQEILDKSQNHELVQNFLKCIHNKL